MSTTVEKEKPQQEVDENKVDYVGLFEVGDRIVIRKHPEHEATTAGFITRVSNANIKAVGLTEGGLLVYDGLYFITDPSYESRPDLRDEPDIAVFDLADSEKLQRKLILQQIAQEAMLTELAAEVATLKSALASQKSKTGALKGEVAALKAEVASQSSRKAATRETAGK